MQRSIDRTDLYKLETLQPRILLSADAEVLDAAPVVDDTAPAVEATLDTGTDDGGDAPIRVLKHPVISDADAQAEADAKAAPADEEVFTDPDGTEYVASDLYRTLVVADDSGRDNGILSDEGAVPGDKPAGCGTEEVDAGAVIYTMGAEEPQANVEDVKPDGTFPLNPDAPEDNVVLDDTSNVDPQIFEMHVTAVPAASAPKAEAPKAEAPKADDATPAAVAPTSEQAAAAASEVNPLLTKQDDLLATGDALLK